jgi:hypothetical protein
MGLRRLQLHVGMWCWLPSPRSRHGLRPTHCCRRPLPPPSHHTHTHTHTAATPGTHAHPAPAQLYNEDINDLLAPQNLKLPIHESKESGVYVAGLREDIVVSVEQVMALIAEGEANRHIGATKMNEGSSRSHTVFRMVRVRVFGRRGGGGGAEGGAMRPCVGCARRTAGRAPRTRQSPAAVACHVTRAPPAHTGD